MKMLGLTNAAIWVDSPGIGWRIESSRKMYGGSNRIHWQRFRWMRRPIIIIGETID
jgi:hypothetical protein